MGHPEQSAGVAVSSSGRIELHARNGGNTVTVELSANQVTDLVAALLKAGMVTYLTSNDMTQPDAQTPLREHSDMHAPVAWPLQIAIATPQTDNGRPTVGLCAAFGDVQLIVGLQRNSIEAIANHLLHVDRVLPASNHIELGA